MESLGSRPSCTTLEFAKVRPCRSPHSLSLPTLLSPKLFGAYLRLTPRLCALMLRTCLSMHAECPARLFSVLDRCLCVRAAIAQIPACCWR